MARVTLPCPERPRRYVFSLTPLADAMFQLLVFFMLSSNLVPYSLLTLQAAAAGSSEIIGEAVSDKALTTGEVAVWTLGRSSILAGGAEFPLDEVDALVRAGAEADITTVVILASQTSSVQDVATVLAALTRAEIPVVQLVQGAIRR